jgi:hypothetical protein
VSTVHASPPDGSGLTSCCGRPPFELPRTDRMTSRLNRVTCSVLKDRGVHVVGKHFVSGSWVSCCEQGETDCPCTCHNEQPSKENRA